MVVNGHGQRALGLILANAMQIEMALDFGRFRHLRDGRRLFGFGSQLFIEDIFAKDDAVVTNIHAGTGDQFFDFRVRFAAKAAQGNVGRSGHEK